MPGTPCPHPSSRTVAPRSFTPASSSTSSPTSACFKRCLARSTEHSQSLNPPSYLPFTTSLLPSMLPSASLSAFAASADVTAPLTTVVDGSSSSVSGFQVGECSGTDDASTSTPAMWPPSFGSASGARAATSGLGAFAAAASASPPKLKRNPPLSPSSAPHISDGEIS